MFRLVLMSGKWYSRMIDGIECDIDDIEELVSCGEIVVLTDDLDGFAEELGISIDDIEKI